LIYTCQPIFTALFAFLLLGETLNPAGYVGGALIGSAVLLVIIQNEDGDEGNSSDDQI
jgi:drug/metabolite transporter (DMT)-like permease